MTKKKDDEGRKTVLLRKSLWKELQTIKLNEEYDSMSDLVAEMLETRRKKK
jgi:predicted CopG family antitoxin